MEIGRRVIEKDSRRREAIRGGSRIEIGGRINDSRIRGKRRIICY